MGNMKACTLVLWIFHHAGNFSKYAGLEKWLIGKVRKTSVVILIG